MTNIVERMRLECRANSTDEWRTLNRAHYTTGDTPTERREREAIQKEMQIRLSQWPQRYAPFALHQFRIVTE